MQDIRWKQRYSNYSSMVALLSRSFTNQPLEKLDEIHLIGLSKSFELSFELMWKLLKDYLEHKEVDIDLKSPKNTLRIAASSGLLEIIDADGDVLMNAHACRNKLVHIYDQEKFLAELASIKGEYLPQMLKVDAYFKALVDADE